MLWKVFVNSLAKIIIFALIAMLLMGLVTNYVLEEEFSSSVMFYVINISPENDYVTTSLMQVIEHLSNDYIQIIESEVMLSPLCEILINDYGIQYTPKEIRSMISSSVTTDASTFTLKITNTDKNHAYVIAQLIANEAPEIIRTFTSVTTVVVGDDNEEAIEPVMDLEKVRVLNNPTLDTEPDSPHLYVNLFLAGLGTAAVVYLICFIRFFFNTVISTEEDIADITDKYPLLGNIPRWE